MQKIWRCRKVIGLTMLISTFLLYFLLPPAQAGMITTEYVIHQDSKKLSDRARVSAFLERAEVIAQMQAYGIHHKEALARVDSLTDSEIDLIAGKMDQIPAGAGTTYTLDGSFLSILGLALYAIVAAIVIYFGFSDEKNEKS
jgi:hypothetical protein